MQAGHDAHHDARSVARRLAVLLRMLQQSVGLLAGHIGAAQPGRHRDCRLLLIVRGCGARLRLRPRLGGRRPVRCMRRRRIWRLRGSVAGGHWHGMRLWMLRVASVLRLQTGRALLSSDLQPGQLAQRALCLPGIMRLEHCQELCNCQWRRLWVLVLSERPCFCHSL